MKTICTYSYDLDCLVATLIYKWVKQVPNYNFVIEPMSHERVKGFCNSHVNKNEGNYIFIGFHKDELVGEGCDINNFKSVKKINHKSLSKIMYDKFKGEFNFTIPQKQLIAMAIDKHLFTYKNKNSYLLDILFHNLSGDRFVYLFGDGMTTIDEISTKVINNSQYCFSEKKEPNLFQFVFKNSLAFVGDVDNLPHYEYEYMKKNDTIVVVDTQRKKVYFRNKNSDNLVLKYCKEYCNGNGTNDYCSGFITNKFMEDIKGE